MTNNLEPAVYIPSVEASDIWLHNHYDQPLYIKYVGLIPQSLELESLVRHGIKISTKGKRRTNDVINISFNRSVKSVSESIKRLEATLSNLQKQLAKYEKLLVKATAEKEKERIQEKIDGRKRSIAKVEGSIEKLEATYWDTMGTKDLRYAIYTDKGFFIDYKDKDGNVTERIKYSISSRSSAKSRTGKVLAIREELNESMKNWRRMGLNLDGRDDVDFVSVLAYESLMGSAIIDTITLEPKHILIVEDYVDVFEREANLVSVDKDTGLLVNNKGMGKFANTIWDGQALLDPEFFTDTTQSMKLLRQHWFKAAAFKCEIQKFMKQRAVELEIEYDKWELPNLYGGTILASEVKCVTTPSSLKFMKVAHVVGGKNEMYQHWIGKVNEEGNRFGVVKTEKPTKIGYTDDDKPIHVMSYQYLNSLPISEEKFNELAQVELKYIEKLKNDESVFIDYILSKADMTNGNEMMAALYRHNPDIVGTKMFREWKKDQIADYIKRVRMGKLKIPNSDYMVLLSNPIELLYASIGKFKGKEMALEGQQVYCKAFDWDKSLIGMRSPHTSMSNILSAMNKEVDSINDYFPDLSKNIVVINNIGATVFERLSGADADSDTMWMSDNSILAGIAQDCNRDYLVCKGDNIKTKPNKYKVCLKDMASIDNELNNDFIGRVTNIAALLCSHIWDSKAKGKDIGDMLDKLSVLSITQGLVIDYAKRIPEISINQQITDANKLLTEMLGEDRHIPKWWGVRNKDIIKEMAKKRKENPEKYKDDDYVFDCPMDYLYRTFSNLPNSNRVEDKDIQLLIRECEAGKANNKQRHIINDILDEANDSLRKSYTKTVDKERKKELTADRLDSISFAVEMLSKLKINEDTMYSIVQNILKNKVDNTTIRSFNMLYHAKKTLFINTFIKK